MKSILRLIGAGGIGMAGIALIAALSFAGCTSLDGGASFDVDISSMGAFGESVAIPVKDFVTLGMVFTEHTFRADTTKTAEVFTYQALLKEAQKLGADAIINVTIDRHLQRMPSDEQKYALEKAYYIQETWYGSALAIKYTTVVPPDTPVTGPRQPAENAPAANQMRFFGQ